MIQSRGGKPLGRYFPELGFPPGRYVVDGEIVIDDAEGGQDFGALQQRIHPAPSRIDDARRSRRRRVTSPSTCSPSTTSRCSSGRSPSGGRSSRGSRSPGIDLTPLTRDPDEAEPWLRSGEGVVAKDLRRALPARRARRDGEGQARAHDRRRRRRLPARQGARHGRLADPRALRRRRRAARRRPLLGPAGGREARAGRQARAVRDRRARPRRSEPLEEREGARVDRAAPRAGRRGHASTTPAAAASATARRSCAGARTSRRPSASSSRCRSEAPGTTPTSSWSGPGSPGSWPPPSSPTPAGA